MLVRALAGEANCDLIALSATDLVSVWQGQSEKLVRCLFKLAKSRKGGCIIFIDSLCGQRTNSDSETAGRVKTELLVQISDLNADDGVLFLAATNTPWMLDEALLRRFPDRIYIAAPNEQARAEILKQIIKSEANNLDDKDFTQLAIKTAGFSGSNLRDVAQKALRLPCRRLRAAKYFRKVSV